MHKNLKSVFTASSFSLPNVMSCFRILLIPLILWLYLGTKHHYLAVFVVLVSGLTDILDGVIARNFNMVTDLGKILDPLADKLTQGALMVCLIKNYPQILILLGLLALKELGMVLSGYRVMKETGTINSARWYGKFCTCLIYFTLVLLFVFPSLPLVAVNALLALCGVTMAFSLVMYILRYAQIRREHKAVSAEPHCGPDS